VGTTNRTHLEDYARAIGEKTALLLKVHTSNFRILGFTAEASLKELIALGKSRGLPVMEDLGSGCFVDLSSYGLEKEPTVQEAIEAGADLVTFSGDKLLGGPQAGIILGKTKYLDLLKKNPLNRALRIDKLTLAGIEATLREYLDGAQGVKNLPVLDMLLRSAQDLERRGKRLRRKLIQDISSLCEMTLKRETSQVGGGALPLQALATTVIGLRPLRTSAANLEARLRNGDPPVIARVKEEEVLLDLRTVDQTEEKALLERVRRALQ
jgi:L-seryl-tRNA(Ser) seleniumtransferase